MQAVNSDINLGDTFRVDTVVAEARVTDYDALVLPGGVANPDTLRSDADAVRFRTIPRGADASPCASACHADAGSRASACHASRAKRQCVLPGGLEPLRAGGLRQRDLLL